MKTQTGSAWKTEVHGGKRLRLFAFSHHDPIWLKRPCLQRWLVNAKLIIHTQVKKKCVRTKFLINIYVETFSHSFFNYNALNPCGSSNIQSEEQRPKEAPVIKVLQPSKCKDEKHFFSKRRKAVSFTINSMLLEKEMDFWCKFIRN